MVEFKLVISDAKTGKSYQKVISGNEADQFVGLKVKDKADGNIIGLNDYELQITGGSDTSGFPMRAEIEGSARKKILIKEGVGFNPKKKKKAHKPQLHYFLQKRKTVVGNTISNSTAQINLKVLKSGSKGIAESFGIEEKKEGPKAKEE